MIHRSIGAVSHGLIDYAMVALLAAGPSIDNFSGRPATTWAYLAAALLFVLAVFTRYPLGIMKRIGLAVHGFVELVMAVCLIAAPWYGKFMNGVLSRNFYWTMGVLMLLLWFLTDFRGIRSRLPTAPVAGRESAPSAAVPSTRQ